MWQTDDGLPQNSVHAIAQTPDGYLWVGTRGGLARFDGVRFTAVDDPDASGLAHAWVTALAVSRDGTLWIGTEGLGVFRFRESRYTRLSQFNGLPSDQVRCLLEDGDGQMWVGTERGLAAYRQGYLTNFTVAQGLGDNSVRALSEGGDGLLRAATKRGLSTLGKKGRAAGRKLGTGKAPGPMDESVFSTVTFAGGWNRNALRAVHQDRRGTLWMGSADGLHCLKSGGAWDAGRVNETGVEAGGMGHLYTTAEGLPDHIVNCVFEDGSGQIWVGTYGGLARIVDGHVHPWPNREAVFGDLVNTVMADREGNLWVGGRDGLYRLNPARFTTFTTQQGLSGNNVISVLEDQTSDAMWLGIWGGGVNLLEGNKVTVFPETNIARDSVLSLCQTRDGKLWIGMDFVGGLNSLAGEVRTAYPLQTGLISAPICVIHEDREGALWVGTREGLNRVSKDKIDTYGVTNGLAANSVEAICEDAKGNLWVGTEGGLSRWNLSTFDRLPTSKPVSALHPDADGTLWVGTRGGGLNRLRGGKLRAYTTRDGLFSDEVYEILEDDLGFFWMSCRQGIFRVAKRDFDELDRGAKKTLACTAFGKADGLVSVQCNGVAKPAGWKARDGRLWFPTIRGVVRVESRIGTNEKPPPVVIEEIRADKKLQPRGLAGMRSSRQAGEAAVEQIRIAPGRGELEIRYTALSLQAPEKNRFKYVLEGADSGWNDAGPERVAHYNNLGPGSYWFRVVACNNDGVWNHTGAAVALVLLPHYWQTWWFQTGVAASLCLLLGVVYRLRIARLREIERLRVEIAANLHDDVGARLTKVAMITEQVDRQTADADRIKPQVRSISQATREVIQAMDEVVWTINPRNDTLDNLANYILHYAQEYFEDTGVRCRLDLPTQLPDLSISTEVRHNLFMTIKEALNNVLKHAAASEVRIALAVEGSAVTVTISDNGKGFDPAQNRSAGEGMRNLKQRLEQIGGSLQLRSIPGSGTTIRMRVDAG
ncbi:MAG TPA: two-component regulator propeller domain-containing protein [Verrucomicrobiae bacterium]